MTNFEPQLNDAYRTSSEREPVNADAVVTPPQGRVPSELRFPCCPCCSQSVAHAHVFRQGHVIGCRNHPSPGWRVAALARAEL